jgi:hypothetical protein
MRVTKARTDRIEKQSCTTESENSKRSSARHLPAVLSNAFIQQLKVQLNSCNARRRSSALGPPPEMTRLQSAIESTEARFTAKSRGRASVSKRLSHRAG